MNIYVVALEGFDERLGHAIVRWAIIRGRSAGSSLPVIRTVLDGSGSVLAFAFLAIELVRRCATAWHAEASSVS